MAAENSFFYYNSCPTHITLSIIIKKKMRNYYMNFSLWTELYRTQQLSFMLADNKIFPYKLLFSWKQHTGLWYKTTSNFNAKWEFIKGNYRIIDHVNIYKGNLCQISDAPVRLLAPAEAEQSQQKDAFRRRQWLRAALCQPIPGSLQFCTHLPSSAKLHVWMSI